MKTFFLCIAFLFAFQQFSYGQKISRVSSNELLIDISKEVLKSDHCSVDKSISVNLFQKQLDETATTCSAQNSWKSIGDYEIGESGKLIIKNSEKGIFKGLIEVKGNCDSDRITKTKIAKVFTTNILNELKVEDIAEKIVGESAELLIYPNPTAEKINIDLSSFDLASDFKSSNVIVNIYGLKGELIYSDQINYKAEVRKEINLKDFAAGDYTVVLKQDDTLLASEKLVKIAQ